MENSHIFCLLLFAGVVEVRATLTPPVFRVSESYPPEDRVIVLEWLSPPAGTNETIQSYRLQVTDPLGNVNSITIPYEVGNQLYSVRNLKPVSTYGLGMVSVGGSGNSDDLYITATTAAGVYCSATPSLIIGSADINAINPQAGDEIVVTSSDVISTNDTMHIDPKCKITDFGGDLYNISINLDECDPRVEVHQDKFLSPSQQPNDTLKYTYTFRLARDASTFHATVNRFPSTACIEVSCTFDREMQVTSEMVKPYIRRIGFSLAPLEGVFNVEFALYQTDAYNTILTDSPVVIPVFDYIFAQLRLEADSSDFVLQTPTCWATPSADSEDPVYEIIDGGCAKIHGFDPANAIVVSENYQSHFTKFKLKSFVWTGVSDPQQAIFIHCLVTVCNTQISDTCFIKPCETRHKRSLPEKDQQTITYGPITIQPDKQPNSCTEKNGGCEDICEEVGGRRFCSCSDGERLMEDGKSCAKIYADVEVIDSSVDHILPTFVVAMGALLALLSLLVFIYKFARTTRKSPAVYTNL